MKKYLIKSTFWGKSLCEIEAETKSFYFTNEEKIPKKKMVTGNYPYITHWLIPTEEQINEYEKPNLVNRVLKYSTKENLEKLSPEKLHQILIMIMSD